MGTGNIGPWGMLQFKTTWSWKATSRRKLLSKDLEEVKEGAKEIPMDIMAQVEETAHPPTAFCMPQCPDGSQAGLGRDQENCHVEDH